MATWSEWFKEAEKIKIPLDKYLVINQPEDIIRLRQSGLPQYNFIVIDGKDYAEEKKRIKEFSEKHEKTWIRIYKKQSKGERHYKLDLNSYQEIISFIKGLKLDLSKFNIQLFEYCDNKFGGNILSGKDRVTIEIIKGSQLLVAHSIQPFFHAQTNPSGKLTFLETNVSEEMINAAKKVLKYIKTSRSEFLEGYFEFIVSDKDKVYFLDYKLGFK